MSRYNYPQTKEQYKTSNNCPTGLLTQSTMILSKKVCKIWFETGLKNRLQNGF